MPVSVVVLTYNESRRIRDCLESVRWADEIVVVDGFSTDDTVAIAREFTGKVYSSDLLGPQKPGGYSDQRNFALEKTTAPWVFFLDADERCTPELADEIRRTLVPSLPEEVTAFRLRRKEFFFGVHSPHTHGSSWLVRLVRRDKARWNGKAVHEGVETCGEIRSLESKILHFSKDSIADYLTTQNRYTSLEVEQLTRSGTPLLRHPLWECFRTFCNIYIYKGAYREGAFGLVMAVFFANYSFSTWAKHWESEMKAGRLSSDRPHFPVLESLAAILHTVWTTLRPPRD